MRLQTLIDWFTRRRRRKQMGLHVRADGSVTIRQGWQRVTLSHTDMLMIMQIKGMQG